MQFWKSFIFLVLAACTLISCGAAWHLKQAKRHERIAIEKGAEIQVDTVYKNVEVRMPDIQMDTVVKNVNFLDTIFVDKNHIITKVKVDIQKRTVYVQSKARGRTITLRQPIYINKTIKAGYTKLRLIWAGVSFLIFGLVVGFLLGKIVRF